jgi:hypothetical protein
MHDIMALKVFAAVYDFIFEEQSSRQPDSGKYGI